MSMSTPQPHRHARPERDEPGDDPAALRLADHAIGLWQAAREIGDPDLLDALKPLVMQIARALARDLMEEARGGTPH